MTITTTTTSTSVWFKRIAAGTLLAVGPALVALGAATDSYADAASTNAGPNMSHPAPHPSFPGQNNQPQPGTSIHHHHQWNHDRG
ncbi:hypothetical protein BayCH28_24100 [Mycolicibacterium sp. CH28]|uniref:hypothetical protein n=1 Tax=Mycolicibacterium sp. CH28 TaxID=2512237 RepID=UPI001080DAAC|nr:hypothetical protein [Mycolicibacterium sp. CH28]TGD84510.1 hypothetical protein BayCH28_24100 [Mycolicibacterium sp. CH28]